MQAGAANSTGSSGCTASHHPLSTSHLRCQLLQGVQAALAVAPKAISLLSCIQVGRSAALLLLLPAGAAGRGSRRLGRGHRCDRRRPRPCCQLVQPAMHREHGRVGGRQGRPP